MKCRNCGRELDDGASKCPHCHAGQSRTEPSTEVGKALRILYDRFGAQTVLTDRLLLVNGLADVISDTLAVNTKKIKNRLRIVMDVGTGSVYLKQLASGQPDGIKSISSSLTSVSQYFGQPEPAKTATPSSVLKPPTPRPEVKTATPEAPNKKNPAALHSVGESFYLGRYENQRIEWRVLYVESDHMLLISRYGLEPKVFHNTTGSVTWANSDMRKWLNTDFYNKAFPEEEKQKMWNISYDDLTDHVVLLDKDETEYYLPTESERRCSATSRAAAKASSAGKKGRSGNVCWWLRADGFNRSSRYYVSSSGEIINNRLGNFDSGMMYVVRPVIIVGL